MTSGQIRVRQVIPADPAVVWQELADIARHVEWMADADTISFVGGQRRGVGTRFDCVTRLGPLHTTDRMEVTSWDDGRAIGVRHVGLVTGEGLFTLHSDRPGQTTVEWAEQLRFRWYLGGPIAALVARPILRRVWQGNLRRLAALTTDLTPE